LEGGPPGFTWDSTCPMILRKPSQKAGSSFAYGAITLYRRPFQRRLAKRPVCNFPRNLNIPPLGSCNPVPATRSGLTQKRFGLFRFRSPLLTESLTLSFPPGTEMFQFPGLARACLCIQQAVIPHNGMGCPIRRSTDHRVRASSRRLSQLTTSFFATWRQGIHRVLIVA
jgi:hypothetical protein